MGRDRDSGNHTAHRRSARSAQSRIGIRLSLTALFAAVALPCFGTQPIATAEPLVYLNTNFDHARKHALSIQRTTDAGDDTGETWKIKQSALELFENGEMTAAIDMLADNRPESYQDFEYDALLAALLQRNDRYADAAGVYWSILREDPAVAFAWIGLGIANDSLNAKSRARAAFEKALQAGNLNPYLGAYAERRIAELQMQ